MYWFSFLLDKVINTLLDDVDVVAKWLAPGIDRATRRVKSILQCLSGLGSRTD